MAFSEVEKLVVPGGMKLEAGSKIGLTGEDADFDVLNRLKAESLLPIQEDLTDWLNKVLGEEADIRVENFLDRLDSGVQLCRLAAIIEMKKKETEQKEKSGSNGPEIRFKSSAVSGSWVARDNVTNFILWCRSAGVKDECLFETEGLVLHRDLRNVILCLLELARIAAQFGLDPPSILKLEKELDLKEQSCRTDELDTEAKVKDTPKVVDTPKKKLKSKSCSNERPYSPKVTNKNEKFELDEKLDKQVMLISGKCCCKDSCNQMIRISHGRYALGRKIINIGILNERHLMVRVGGGWDTLEHYLAVHDPCKIKEFQRKHDSIPFLHVQGRYKVNKNS